MQTIQRQQLSALQSKPTPGCRFRRKPATYSDLIAATLPI
jgi:hypothetical protein